MQHHLTPHATPRHATSDATGMLAGALVSGVQLAVSMSNTGGAWDNTKKYIEAGATNHAREFGGKGSDCHKVWGCHEVWECSGGTLHTFRTFTLPQSHHAEPLPFVLIPPCSAFRLQLSGTL